jgi:hypothetical protein
MAKGTPRRLPGRRGGGNSDRLGLRHQVGMSVAERLPDRSDMNPARRDELIAGVGALAILRGSCLVAEGVKDSAPGRPSRNSTEGASEVVCGPFSARIAPFPTSPGPRLGANRAYARSRLPTSPPPSPPPPAAGRRRSSGQALPRVAILRHPAGVALPPTSPRELV